MAILPPEVVRKAGISFHGDARYVRLKRLQPLLHYIAKETTMSSTKGNISPDYGKLRLADAEAQHDVSKLAVFVLDAAGKVLSSAPVDKEGQFKLATDVRGAQRVAIAEAPNKGEEPNLKNAIEFHAGD